MEEREEGVMRAFRESAPDEAGLVQRTWVNHLAWTLVVLLLTSTRPEGDFLFSAGLGSYVFLLGGMFIGVMCATLPVVSQPGALAARLGK